MCFITVMFRITFVIIIGFKCLTACSPNCANPSANGADLTCNKTTLVCLHGCKGNFEGGMCDRCKRGWIGQQCNIECDYNCQNCTVQDGKGVCDTCLPGYYYNFNKDCVQCRSSCLRLNKTDDYTCDQNDGTCLYGCKNAYYGDRCERGCSPFCINKTCNRHDGCCTIDYCRYDTHGGCECQKKCNSNCESGTCYQNETCQLGCKLNTWGPDCRQTCNVNCVAAPDFTTPTCGRDGVCSYGCKMTFMGPRCSDSCPANCINNNCNATSGHCLQGCEKDYWGDLCDTNCSTNCLQSSETTCYQDDGTCAQGCVEDHYGPFCGQGCPANCLNDTCQRDNGTCSLGCTKGFTGEYCNLTACPSSCAKLSTNDTSLTCNKTSLACLHGCVENFEGDRCDRCRRGWIGPQCDIQCDYNCQNCTLKNGEGVCNKCLPGYYYFNKNCVQCRSSCLRLNITDEYICDQDDGTCLYGCMNGYLGDQCEKGCSPLCINRTCNRHDGCCTIDYCRYNTYGGCDCQKRCNSNCERGTCFKNETCSQGCKMNSWGHNCNQTCSENCLHANDNSTSVCNKAGECIFGCKDTYTGSQCIESCSVGCLNNTCDQATGSCLNGCMTGWYGSFCNNTSPNSGDVSHKLQTYSALMLIVYILVWMEIVS